MDSDGSTHGGPEPPMDVHQDPGAVDERVGDVALDDASTPATLDGGIRRRRHVVVDGDDRDLLRSNTGNNVAALHELDSRQPDAGLE